MKRLVAILGVVLMLFTILQYHGSDEDFQKAKKQLIEQGYSKIQYTGYSVFCCDPEDLFRSGFKAVNKEGDNVDGCVCGGVFQGYIIRYK